MTDDIKKWLVGVEVRWKGVPLLVKNMPSGRDFHRLITELKKSLREIELLKSGEHPLLVTDTANATRVLELEDERDNIRTIVDQKSQAIADLYEFGFCPTCGNVATAEGGIFAKCTDDSHRRKTDD